MTYTVDIVRKLLSDYQRLAQGARMRPPEDRLGSRSPPLDEAPWAGTARLKSDLEQALRSLTFERMQILFMTICVGESSWRNGMKRYDWRTKVADWWGRTARNGDGKESTMTPGDVNKIVDEALEEICDSLNGVAVDNSIM